MSARTYGYAALVAAAGMHAASADESVPVDAAPPISIGCGLVLVPAMPETVVAVAAREPVVAAKPQAVKDERPKIEVVFVLDTTGSMSGLIAAAKDKVWAIANTLATADPAPEIKLGLVGYRDRGDAYVTTVTDLTDDLDAVYAELTKFQADGGGDGPESVNQALHEAVTKIGWSGDGQTLRVIYLVGDAPPHMDYENDVLYPAICEAAVKREILINAIQCGSMGGTAEVWQEIAKRAEGQYFQIAADGGRVVAATPFDAKLAELAGKLDATRCYYGTAAVREQQEARQELAADFAKPTYASSALTARAAYGRTFDAAGAPAGAEATATPAPTAALARRAAFNATEAGLTNFLGKQELVFACASGAVKLEDLKPEELPEDLRKLSKDELQTYLDGKAAERETLQAEIRKLADERQKFIEAEHAKDETAPEFDLKLYGTLRNQAAKKGIEYAAPSPSF